VLAFKVKILSFAWLGRVKPEIATLSAIGKIQNFDLKC